MKVKQYLLASAICVVPFAASAAPPTPFTWTGLYIGANGGAFSQSTTARNLDGFFPVGPADDQSVFGGTGGLFGFTVGYNYQMNHYVFSLETDIAASTVNDNYTYRRMGFDITTSSKLSSLGTIRGRFGYALNNVLFYVAGGFAYGHVNNELQVGDWAARSLSTSGMRTGWTVGGGLDYAVANNWIVRAEVIYVDLGTVTGTNRSGCSFAFSNTYTGGRIAAVYKY
jgi:outer membrane immunogenic protein